MKLVETIISETTVKMRYANHEDASEAKHWIDFQVPLHELKQVSDTALGDPEPHFLSTVRLAALRYARKAIDDEIQGLMRRREGNHG